VTDHPNLEAARSGYAAFAAGDLATVSSLFADDIVWHTGGNNILTGDHVGREAVLAFFGRLMQETEGSYHQDIHDMLANDEHGVALVTVTASRGGKTFEGPVVQVFHMRDQKMTEFWAFPEDPAAFDEVFS